MVISLFSLSFGEETVVVIFWEYILVRHKNASSKSIFFMLGFGWLLLLWKQTSKIINYLLRLNIGKNKKDKTPRMTTRNIWELQTIQPKAFPAVSDTE